MTASTDLKSMETLCDNAADAALDLLIGLGARPTDSAAAATWDAQDALLKNKISTLNNLGSSIGATIVAQALEQVWPQLDALEQATAAAQASTAKIDEINKALVTLAAVINFATAAITLITQPSVDNAGKLVTAFKGFKSQQA
jgi:hypothetical protein